MCTVTYIPLPEGQFALTSNRDENAARSPRLITAEELGGHQVIFPRDTLAGGTWVATSGADRTVCLLNGAFELHQRKPSYKRSRGIMVLDFFRYANAGVFFENYDFPGMEPFTMIIVEGRALYELRWNEERPLVKKLDPDGSYIWSSATLYPAPIRQKREQWFANWLLDRRDFSREAILQFHQTAGDGDHHNDVVMNRDGIVQTVSITSIMRTDRFIDMHYQSLVRQELKYQKIPLSGEMVGFH